MHTILHPSLHGADHGVELIYYLEFQGQNVGNQKKIYEIYMKQLYEINMAGLFAGACLLKRSNKI